LARSQQRRALCREKRGSSSAPQDDRPPARNADQPIPAALPSDEPLFEVPDGLIRIFDRDLVFAGLARIEKRGGNQVGVKTDDRGRTIDIHALRHTFGTHMSKAGVPLRTA
jgi:integrase